MQGRGSCEARLRGRVMPDCTTLPFHLQVQERLPGRGSVDDDICMVEGGHVAEDQSADVGPW